MTFEEFKAKYLGGEVPYGNWDHKEFMEDLAKLRAKYLPD